MRSGSFRSARLVGWAVFGPCLVFVNAVAAAGTAGIRWQVAEWAAFGLSGTTSRQWSHGTAGSDLERHSALPGVTVGKTFPVF